MPFWPENQEVGRSIIFFFNLGAEEMQYIHVCAFLGTRNLRIKVNPGVERRCIPQLYLVKEPFLGYLFKKKKVLTFYLNIFVKKCKIEYLKKKRKKKKKKS